MYNKYGTVQTKLHWMK